LKRLVALVPNVLELSPGQRARIELWAWHLEQAGWHVRFEPFASERLQEVLYERGRTPAKAMRLLDSYLRHLLTTLRGFDADVVFVYREAALIGPALTERIAARRAPVIYDIDDPTFIPYRSPFNGWLSLLKFPGKTNSLIRLSDHVIAINRPIADYALRYNPSVSVMPNLIDTDRYRPADQPSGYPPHLVWIGSHSTTSNLETLTGPLSRLQQSVRAPLRIIADRPVALAGVETEHRPWSSATEVGDLASASIGIVPLNDLPWNRWKFFFKTLQCMAVGLPVVARRIGSNPEVIEDGVNGFLVESEHEWHDRLLALVRDPGLRRRIGQAARATVLDRYSVERRMPDVVAIFDTMVSQRAAGAGSAPARTTAP
jgi:glycosyltransferase involved in cell wall biosynthesis